jgi:rRNA maturation endonuclease Nob1
VRLAVRDLSRTTVATKRFRCIRCRSWIDPDLHDCPFCGEPNPLRYRRSRRLLVGALAVVMALLATAWVMLP